jgi:hypothetical protein
MIHGQSQTEDIDIEGFGVFDAIRPNVGYDTFYCQAIPPNIRSSARTVSTAPGTSATGF